MLAFLSQEETPGNRRHLPGETGQPIRGEAVYLPGERNVEGGLWAQCHQPPRLQMRFSERFGVHTPPQAGKARINEALR